MHWIPNPEAVRNEIIEREKKPVSHIRVHHTNEHQLKLLFTFWCLNWCQMPDVRTRVRVLVHVCFIFSRVFRPVQCFFCLFAFAKQIWHDIVRHCSMHLAFQIKNKTTNKISHKMLKSQILSSRHMTTGHCSLKPFALHLIAEQTLIFICVRKKKIGYLKIVEAKHSNWLGFVWKRVPLNQRQPRNECSKMEKRIRIDMKVYSRTG